MKSLREYKKILFAVFTFCFATALAFLLTKNIQPTEAANLSNFKAGNIISDYTMGNYGSMSRDDINSFLHHSMSCDDYDLKKTNIGGYRWEYIDTRDSSGIHYNYRIYFAPSGSYSDYHVENGHFVCLADETFNGQSAADLIYDVAHKYRINPQVLIVLLQKEQGLISDKFPNAVQYRAATGYGCPDTAACDSEYYGFKNQLENAAGLFRYVLDNGSYYKPVGNNYIQYNPNSGCGGSTVYIENRATAALYQYTPYQPNGSALNAGYGIGDGCSAYGNRNFYLYFSDWFGESQSDGFIPMEESRFLVLNKTAERIYPYSLNTYDTLTEGRILKFTSKTTTIDGSWCLRTEHNTTHNIAACVRLEDLDEIPMIIEDIPEDRQERVIETGAKKVFMRGQDTVMDFSQPVLRAFKQKATVMGKTYYITEFDAPTTKYGIPEEYISDSPYLALKEPIERVLSRNIDRIDPVNDNYYDTLAKGRVLTFTSKIIYSGKTYYRTAHNTTNHISAVIPEDALDSLPEYQPFETPRFMVLKHETDRINPFSGTYYDTLPSGLVLRFTTKIYINGQWYYRTEHNTNNNIDAVLPAQSVKELQ